MVFQLSKDEVSFPDPRAVPLEMREADGLFAVGGDLSAERLLLAYQYGIFPWTSFRDLEGHEDEAPRIWNQLRWYCPLERFVIYPREVHVSHSMRSLINKKIYRVSIDEAFEQVIKGCSEVEAGHKGRRIDEEGAWLGPQMMEAYTHLHQMGYAHSVEVWQGEELVGGLYGVLVTDVFCGESMFSRVPSASKLALIGLCQKMDSIGVRLVDCQLETPHLRSMGGRFISYEEYLGE